MLWMYEHTSILSQMVKGRPTNLQTQATGPNHKASSSFIVWDRMEVFFAGAVI